MTVMDHEVWDKDARRSLCMDPQLKERIHRESLDNQRPPEVQKREKLRQLLHIDSHCQLWAQDALKQ